MKRLAVSGPLYFPLSLLPSPPFSLSPRSPPSPPPRRPARPVALHRAGQRALPLHGPPQARPTHPAPGDLVAVVVAVLAAVVALPLPMSSVGG